MKIEIRIIPNNKQRYNTVGDWQYDEKDGTLFIDVSDMKNDRFESLVAIHELIEANLCLSDGITSKMVDDFDMGPIGSNLEEPGDSLRSPYFKQHGVASGIERILATLMFIDNAGFDAVIKKMGEEYNPPPIETDSEKAP